MTYTARKIGIILSVIIIIPPLLFAIYQLTSLNESEEVIERTYKAQLDAILYSVNQYSEDVTTSWMNRINRTLEEPNYSEEIKNILKENSAVKLFFLKEKNKDIQTVSLLDSTLINPDLINFVLSKNKDKINRLVTYKRGGYTKVEPFSFEGFIFLLFLPDNFKDLTVAGILILPHEFVTKILSPKMQAASQQEFTLCVTHKNSIIYSTEKIEFKDLQQQRELWLIPEYKLGILLKGRTIEGLVKERFYTNLIMLGILILVLAAGVWVVFRNIKKELELAQTKSDFVSNVSHELRTPLALISMFSETLEMGRVRSEEKKQEYYSIISQESNRLSNIVNKILNFSKMEAGKRTFHLTSVNINTLIDEIYNTYRFHLQNKGFKFEVIKQDSLPNVDIDKDAISEAVINLIDNAVKYSQDKKEVKVRTGSDNDFVYIEVEDKGIGISEENQKKIFDKFFRVTSGLVHNTKGTGLGLTLVKHIVDSHKGIIELKSTPWVGSSFKLKFRTNHQG